MGQLMHYFSDGILNYFMLSDNGNTTVTIPSWYVYLRLIKSHISLCLHLVFSTRKKKLMKQLLSHMN